jgi:hypothetical protein
MAVSRRHFLGLGRYVLAAVALPKKFVSEKLFSSSGRSETARLSSFSMQTFLPLVNSSFAVHSGSTTSTWLTLLSVEDMTPKTPTGFPAMAVLPKPSRTPQPSLNTFALHFLGTGENLSQDTYELEHAALGRFLLFIVPSNSGTGRETYTAIFNHLLGGRAVIQPPTRPVQPAQPLQPVQPAGAAPAPAGPDPAGSESPLPTLRGNRAGRPLAEKD